MNSKTNIYTVVVNTDTSNDYKEVLTTMTKQTLRLYVDMIEQKQIENGSTIFSVIIADRVSDLTIRKIIKMTQDAFSDVRYVNNKLAQRVECPTIFSQIRTNKLSEGIDFGIEHRVEHLQQLELPQGKYYFPLHIFVDFDKDDKYDRALRKLRGNILLHNIPKV